MNLPQFLSFSARPSARPEGGREAPAPWGAGRALPGVNAGRDKDRGALSTPQP